MSLPPHHVGGLAILWRTLLAGATAILPAERNFRPGSSSADLATSGQVTHLSLVTTQLQRLLQVSTRAPTEVQGVLVGGGPTARPLLHQARACGWPVLTTYGSSETSSQVTTLAPSDPVERLSTAGRVLHHRELRIDDSGEILVRGRTVCPGYLQAGEIHPVTDSAGWYHTGDTGTLTKEGYLVPLGRMDSMFISGGENIQPEALEAALSELGCVRAVVIVPVPDAEFGQRPVALVQSGDPTLDGPRLRRHLETRFPRFMLPVRYLAWDGPSGGGLKPPRSALAQLARESRLPEL